MKKSRSKATRSTVALAATVLVIPIAGASQDATAQKPTPTRKLVIQSPDTGRVIVMHKNVAVKLQGEVRLVGLDKGRIIYQNSKDEQFYLDPETGDMRFVTNLIVKQPTPLVAQKMLKNPTGSVKGAQVNINIIGTDDNGNVLHRNANGEVFYLDPKTGDMVYVK